MTAPSFLDLTLSSTRRSRDTWVGGGGLFTFTHDVDDHLLTSSDANATLTYTYNSGGWMASEATSGPGTGQPS
ncbi:MAG: hypothetical protein SFX72_22755, partial [Isosphaeraceae bacterium]|nr:hypothetical protein [Isosphaeraceae bacterium]